MTEDVISKEKFAEFVVVVVDTLANLQEVLVRGVLKEEGENILVRTGALGVHQQGMETLANNLLLVAGLPPLNIVEVDTDGEEQNPSQGE